MAFSLVTPLRLPNGSLGASPGGDGGREAGGDRALPGPLPPSSGVAWLACSSFGVTPTE